MNRQNMVIKKIIYGSEAHKDAVELRFKILRAPLGLTFTPAFLEMEKDDLHLASFDNAGNITACLILTPLSNQEIKMRQVAVREDMQGKGVGSALVKHAEKYASQLGFQTMVLNARLTAVQFYLKNAYATQGEQFEEVGIPHFKMKKNLENNSGLQFK